MPRIRATRYDKIAIYTEPELIDMCLKEGMSLEDARIKAKKMHKELNTYAEHEAYFWRKVRQQEVPSGLEPDTLQAKDQRYAAEEGLE